MKKTSPYLLLLLLAVSCKAPIYNYHSPAMNTTPYSQGGEGHLGVNAGTFGLAAKAGIAVGEQVNINATISGLPKAEDVGSYHGGETEVSIGFQTKPVNQSVFAMTGGVGAGRNSHPKKGFHGSFTRPFLQLQKSVVDRNFISESMKWDASFGMRINYLLYNGNRNGQNFDHNHFYYEPFFAAAIGGKNVRFEIIQGFSIKNTGEWESGARIFPYFAGIGLLVKLRKSVK